MCKAPATTKPKLTLDHVIPASKSGPTVVGNLVTACEKCNTKKTNQSLADFLAKDPEQLAKIQQQVDQLVPLTPAGHLNSVMPAMLRVPENTGLPVTISDGVSTAFTRHQLGIPKNHVNDAACLDLPIEVNNHSGPVTVLKRQCRRRRQSINCNAKGSPDSKYFGPPTAALLPKSTQGYATPPAHSVGPRQIAGIRARDIVRINHHSGQNCTGRTTLALKSQRVKIKTQGQPTMTAAPSKSRLIAHAGRWTASRPKPTPAQH